MKIPYNNILALAGNARRRSYEKDIFMNENTILRFSEELTDILKVHFRDAAHVEQFMQCVADRASGRLMKYLGDTLEELRREEIPEVKSQGECTISRDEAQRQISNLADFTRRNAPGITHARKIERECTSLPPCFGSIWEICSAAADFRPDFPILESVLLVETPAANDEVIQGIPLSHWPEMKTKGDLVFFRCEFHPAILVNLMLEQPIPLSRLNKCTGHLNDQESDLLLAHLEGRDSDNTSSDVNSNVPHGQTENYFDPRCVFQEFMTIATTPLRLEALQILDRQTRTSQSFDNVVGFKSVRNKLQEKRHLLGLAEPTTIPLAAHGDTDGREAVLQIEINNPETVFHITQKSINTFRIELAYGKKEVFEDAKIISNEGALLATIHDGVAECELPDEGDLTLQLENGTVISAGEIQWITE